jgi:hypothetical protein
MMKAMKNVMNNPEEWKRQLIFWIFRFFIILSIIAEIQASRESIFYLNLFVFLLTFTPFLIRKVFSIYLPLGIEFLFLTALLLTTFLEKILAGILVQIILGMFFGVIGFLLMYVFYYNSRMGSKSLLIAVFSFCFSVSAGAVWEVFRYLLISLSEFSLGGVDVDYTPRGLLSTMCGAIVVSGIGYLYLKHGSGKASHRFLDIFMRKNPELFSNFETSPEYIQELIKQGENEKLEFKSTLRVNLHTKEPDKKIEHSMLKTITAFLNSNGGILLVGVSDKGAINGIEADAFQNTDQFYRHYTNLLKTRIGNEYLPFIQSFLVLIQDHHVLKIECKPCNNPVFLLTDQREEFYVRAGPASVRLEGRKLINYVNEKFYNGEKSN